MSRETTAARDCVRRACRESHAFPPPGGCKRVIEGYGSDPRRQGNELGHGEARRLCRLEFEDRWIGGTPCRAVVPVAFVTVLWRAHVPGANREPAAYLHDRPCWDSRQVGLERHAACALATALGRTNVVYPRGAHTWRVSPRPEVDAAALVQALLPPTGQDQNHPEQKQDRDGSSAELCSFLHRGPPTVANVANSDCSPVGPTLRISCKAPSLAPAPSASSCVRRRLSGASLFHERSKWTSGS